MRLRRSVRFHLATLNRLESRPDGDLSLSARRETGAVLHLTDEMVVVHQHYLLGSGYTRLRPFKR
jgi:hypothetical protein